jgi:hypothetical protein
MMDILELIAGAQGGGPVNQLASQFGLKPEQARSAMAALIPAVAAGLQRNMATEPGLSGLLSALESGRHETYLESPDRLSDPTTTTDGNAILGHVLGSKDVSRQVAANASQQTGIDPAVLKKMLPLVAALAMAGLSRQTKTAAGGAAKAAGLAALLGPLLGGSGQGAIADGLGGMLGDLLRGRRRD